MRVSRVPKANASTRARRGDAGLHVLEQHARVGRHRARDVEHEHEPARALGRARASGARAARRPGAASTRAVARRSGTVPRRRVGRRAAAAAGRPARGEAARAGAARRPARRPCRRRSRACAAAPRRSTRPAWASSSSSAGAGSSPDGTRVRGSGGAGDRAELGEGIPRRLAREHEPEGLAERLLVGARGAQRRAQGVERVLARARVHGGEGAVGGEHVAHARRARRARAARRRGPGSRPVTAARGCPRRAAQAPCSTPRSRTRSRSSRTLSATPSVSSRSAVGSSASRARAQVIVSPTPGHLVELLAAQPRDGGADPADDLLGRVRQPRRARSPPRARATGSRSSGRGSGA